MASSPSDQIAYGNLKQLMFTREIVQLLASHHGSISINQFAKYAHGFPTCQAGKITGRLGVPLPGKDATPLRAKWKYVTGPPQA